MHTSLRRHTIDDVQRVVIIQRSHTTDANRRCTARVTVGLDVHAWHATLQGLHWVVLVLLGHLIDAHRRYGTSQVGLTLGGITCHHHLIQRLCIGFHLDLHAVLGR